MASDSTISTAVAVPATTRSSFESLSSVWVGLSTYSPLMKPTRAAPIGPSNGRPDSDSAADAPIIAGMSALTSGLDEITVAMICTSLKKPSGNSGRMGRSIRREVSVSPSDGRLSRLRKPPGMRPAA